MKLRRSLARTITVARKEARHILRDTRSLIMALAVPFVLLLLFGYALTLDVDRVPTLVYDHDRSPQSRELIERFAGSRYFRILGSVDKYRGIERSIDRDQASLPSSSRRITYAPCLRRSHGGPAFARRE
jgi:ABC-2 type transport system permease protein